MIKIVILDQNKLIWLIFKKKKSKIQKSIILYCTFIIKKLEISIQKTEKMEPILKSNSTSFMFNSIFCEIDIKKVIHCEGAEGNGGTIIISSWQCNYSIYIDIQVYYLDIQAISTLLCLLLILDV